MLSQTKLFDTSWKQTFITENLDFIFDGDSITHLRFDTMNSDFKTPDNLKPLIEQQGQLILACDSNNEIPEPLEKTEEAIKDFLTTLIKAVKNNPNNKVFDSELTQTLKDYKKLNLEYIVSTGQKDQVIAFYEVIPNN